MDLNRQESVRSGRSVRIASTTNPRPGPARQLSRMDSIRENPQNKRVYVDRFETMPFADPKPRRAYPMGPYVHTEEHVLLLRRLRMEAARLSEDLASSRNKVAILTAEIAVTESRLATRTQDNRRLVARLEESSRALIRAQAAFENFDALYRQNKRQTQDLVDFNIDVIDIAQDEPARAPRY